MSSFVLKSSGIEDFRFFLVLEVQKGYVRLKKLGLSYAFEVLTVVELNRSYNYHEFLEFLHVNQNLLASNVLDIRNYVLKLLKMKRL